MKDSLSKGDSPSPLSLKHLFVCLRLGPVKYSKVSITLRIRRSAHGCNSAEGSFQVLLSRKRIDYKKQLT